MARIVSGGKPFGGHFYLRQWTLGAWGQVDEKFGLDSPRKLFIDRDNRHVPKLVSILATLRKCNVRVVWVCLTRSRHGWHVVVYLANSYPLAERIGLQLLCQSDRAREIFNLRRAISTRKNDPGTFWKRRANILFERKAD